MTKLASRFFLAMLLLTSSALAWSATSNDPSAQLYQQLGLQDDMSFEVFHQAYQGYQGVKNRKKSMLTIIDYSKPSSQKRFFVIDMDKKELLIKTYVSHGVNSGALYAKKFSNNVNSRQTSLGVFLTSETYYGANGYSLRIDGLTPGKNDRARKRYIVVHGAKYANPDMISKTGQLGRSWGCPAIPTNISRKVIDLIKGGSVIFSYA
ncbi:hypothetical protein VST7929_02818 [Vibrio stylophorae]|uniref:Peptidase n=1 Tax=Vibrio stylophorae TaxID=659351 RepID=A0ABM8ZWX9_9VIBR|nr:murein L,D-transpeptidase catalytic domain family protein [Vibrio stylophorae]CAH0535157.1 hypothetical protein VST7929_02818 [Vibrio stylophorae]